MLKVEISKLSLSYSVYIGFDIDDQIDPIETENEFEEVVNNIKHATDKFDYILSSDLLSLDTLELRQDIITYLLDNGWVVDKHLGVKRNNRGYKLVHPSNP